MEGDEEEKFIERRKNNIKIIQNFDVDDNNADNNIELNFNLKIKEEKEIKVTNFVKPNKDSLIG